MINQRTGTTDQQIAAVRQPFELSDELSEKIAALGLEEAVRQVEENGYGYIQDLASIEFISAFARSRPKSPGFRSRCRSACCL